MAGNYFAQEMNTLQQLTKAISDQNLIPEDLRQGMNLSELVQKFFAKASAEFLQNNTVETLSELVSRTTQLIADICSSLSSNQLDSTNSPNVRINPMQSPDGSLGILVVLPDRPFIVNTISECLLERNLAPDVFLHPILTVGNLRFSCSYLRLPNLSSEDASGILSDFQGALADLLIITADHSAMLLCAQQLSDSLFQHSKGEQDLEKETAEFIEWISEGNFVFLGITQTLLDHPEKQVTQLGVFRSGRTYVAHVTEEVTYDARTIQSQPSPILISRLQSKSPIHRIDPMVNITLRVPGSNGSGASTLWSISGLLTSKARAQESSGVPLIRRKLQKLIELENVVFNSHDYKYLVDIIDSMPKDEALRLDISALQEIVHVILEMQHRHEIRVSYRHDTAHRGVSMLVVMPRDRFNSQVRQKIQQKIESLFGAAKGSSEYHLNYTNKPLIRFYFYVPLPSGVTPSPSESEVQQAISELSRTWSDNLTELIEDQYETAEAQRLKRLYADTFTPEYQALYTIEDALFDIRECEKMQDKPLHVTLSDAPEGDNPVYTISTYRRNEHITISIALPILDNLGLEVLNEDTSVLDFQASKIYIHRFSVKVKNNTRIHTAGFDERVAPAIVSIIGGESESDSLNSLLIDAELSIRSVSLLRVYCALLWQITKFASRQTIFDSLSSYPQIARHFWVMFEVKFDPTSSNTLEERSQDYQRHLDSFKDELRQVSDITKDRILRGLLALLSASIRTNFYQSGESIAIKFRSREVDIMPNPKPLYEIFVSSKQMEGVHLRNGPVSRGGIRWSDRVEDYRSEILGLMATQTMKNVLIVPDGAKGGFIVRTLPKNSAEVPAAVQSAYRDFIRSLLSISDNRAGEKIIKPPQVVCWDQDDPYLVVAADKGTATFSDTANDIAVTEFNFWLDDAFASGGSFGYDHKKYAITARGAWESARRHFADLKIDIDTQPFTAVGIGDMSGDVFGNGLLLSRTIQLIGAFDHRHVFIDPNPDPERAFHERKRLFEKPRSQWSDYNKELISAGGGVFGRYEKEIPLSSEIRLALGIDPQVPAVVSGEELISFVLKAPVNLLFNGGIGTYVKAASQSHADVNDGTNDRVRIDASELRAQIVVEGGNLGLTQKARVEYAENGGRINTDAIDNSGGVDLSDHEVNLKVLFGELCRAGALTREGRDKLMVEIAPEVVSLVLTDNRYHALLLSVAVNRSRRNIAYFHSFINLMVKLGYVTRHRDSLPDDDALNDRAARKLGLVRPELAVCLAASKRWMKTNLLASDLPRHPLLQRRLLEYFPETLQKLYPEAILAHPLGENIIATQVTNYLVNSTGVTFLHRMCLKYSIAPAIALTCILAADAIIGSEQIQTALWKFDRAEKSDLFLKWWMSNSDTLREATSWLISRYGNDLSLQELIDLFQPRFQILVDHAEDILSGEDQLRYQARLDELTSDGLPREMARRLALYPEIVRIFEMLWSSKKSLHSIPVATTLYALILEELHLNKLLQQEPRIDTASKWESELLSHSFDEIRHSVSLLSVQFLDRNITDPAAVVQAIKGSPNYEQMSATLAEVEGTIPSVTAVAVIARLLSSFKPAFQVEYPGR